MLQILVGKKRITVGCFDKSPCRHGLVHGEMFGIHQKRTIGWMPVCPFPFFLLVNLDWNPWDFVAFKFNSITTRGGWTSQVPTSWKVFQGVGYLTKLPSFKTTFWRGFNLENKVCFESTTTPHTHHHWRFSWRVPTIFSPWQWIGNPIVGYYDIFSIYLYIYTHLDTGCLYTIPLYRSYITLAQPVCSVSFTYEHEALFQMRRGMRDGDDGGHLQDGWMEWWQRWIDA